jgi:uncharacterized protein YqgC (DUF456 family)
MIRRLAVLALVVGFAGAVAFNLPDWALIALAVLAWGVYFALIRKERRA